MAQPVSTQLAALCRALPSLNSITTASACASAHRLLPAGALAGSTAAYSTRSPMTTGSGWQHHQQQAQQQQARWISAQSALELLPSDSETDEADAPLHEADLLAPDGDSGSEPGLLYQPQSDDQTLATEGEVALSSDEPIARALQRHWQQLPMAYRQRISYDEFGVRYIRQIDKEEEARQRALHRLKQLDAVERPSGWARSSTGGSKSHRKRAGAADAPQGRLQGRYGSITRQLVDTWYPLLQAAIQHEQEEILSCGGRDTKRDRANYGPYLLLLTPEDLAIIAIQSVLSHTAGGMRRGSEEGGEAAAVPAVQVADAIGRAVHDHVAMLRYKARQREYMRQRGQHRQHGLQQESHPQGFAASGLAAEDPHGVSLGERTAAQLRAHQQGILGSCAQYERGLERVQRYTEQPGLRARSKQAAALVLAGDKWDVEARIKVGAALLALLVENSPTPDPAARRGQAATTPGFEYRYQRLGPKRQAFIRASSALCTLIGRDESLKASMLAKHPPMLIPPQPWVSHSQGGYLTMRNWFMRTRYSANIKRELQQCKERMYPTDPNVAPDRGYQEVLDALNVLGNTAWRINTPVLAVMDRYWRAKQAVAGLPSQAELPLPQPPNSQYRLVHEAYGLVARSGQPTRDEKREHQLACDEVRKAKRNAASLVASFNLKLNVARDFADEPEFYYPHTVDFRGRAYPMHPNLHHLGDDMQRSLLTFAHGRPLGPHGLDWLYVHLANMWGQGVDKQSFDVRRQFARGQLQDVLLCADQPEVYTWWQDAEKPWQFLATCFEIRAALASFNPEAYESRLPVHMDGSCNGLQHYAALGRDEAGGRAVNLLPSDTPQDVYKGVAEIVKARVAEDARAGRQEAKYVQHAVDRKLVKQTVMTSVYGVTNIGAREQIEARLRDKGWKEADRDLLWATSKYLADCTMDAIGEMFTNAKQIMKWLADCAQLVAAQGQPVCWVNPCGLPISQPYHTIKPSSLSTVSQVFNVQREGGDAGAPVTKGRQRSAFPPNYIHSLDSAHMMRTANACAQADITFAGVHDSFWTHAGSVGEMNRILREEFVALHTRTDLLADLRNQLARQHPGVSFPPVPERGSLQVSRVRQSRYFFS